MAIDDFLEVRTPFALRRLIEKGAPGEWARWHRGVTAAHAPLRKLVMEFAERGLAHVVQQTDEPAGADHRVFDYLVSPKRR